MSYWHEKCRGGNPNVKIPLDCRRADAVRKMLSSFTPQALCEAIDGAERFPWQHYDRRYPEPGPGRDRRDDLDYICADVKRVEMFRELRDGDEAQKAYRRYVFELCRRHPLIVAALAMLAGEDVHGSVLAKAALWAKEQERAG